MIGKNPTKSGIAVKSKPKINQSQPTTSPFSLPLSLSLKHTSTHAHTHKQKNKTKTRQNKKGIVRHSTRTEVKQHCISLFTPQIHKILKVTTVFIISDRGFKYSSFYCELSLFSEQVMAAVNKFLIRFLDKAYWSTSQHHYVSVFSKASSVSHFVTKLTVYRTYC